MLARAFEPGGEVHAVADDRVVHALPAADVPGDHGVGVEADSHVEHRVAAPAPLDVPLTEALDHGDGGSQRPILVVVAWHGQAEHGHDRVADELVEHAPLVEDALDHPLEVVVEQRHRGVGAEALGQRCELPDVAEEDRGEGFRATEQVAAGVLCEQPVRQLGIHVARERRANALLVGDVLDDDQRAELRLVAGPERQDADVRRDGRPVDRELRIERQVACARLAGPLDPLDEPLALGKDLGRRFPDDVRLLPSEDAAPGRVARLRQAFLVESDDAVRHALQHALVVVAHRLHVGEELRVLESARDLCGEGA